MADFLQELINRQRRREQSNRISEGLRTMGGALMGQPYTPRASSGNNIEDFIAQEQIKNQMEEEKQRRNMASISPMLQQGGFRIKSISSSGEPSYERIPSPEEIAPKIVKVGENVISVNPQTGESEVVFEAKGKSGKTLPSPLLTKISDQANSYYGMEDAENALTSAGDRFKKYMGPGKDKELMRLPIMSRFNKELPDFLAWQSGVQDAFQQYRKAVTGAQASEGELRMLERNRPSEKDTYETFVAKTRELKKIGSKVMRRYFDTLKKSGYDVSGFESDMESLENVGATNEGVNRVGSTFTGKDGKIYKIVGGDPNDPDVEEVK